MKKNQAPATRMKFTSDSDELNYVKIKVEYYLHEVKNRSAAVFYRNRLSDLISRLKKKLAGSILLVECNALLSELNHDKEGELEFREKELEVIEEILKAGVPVGKYDAEYLDLSKQIVESLRAQVAEMKSEKRPSGEAAARNPY